MVPASFPSPRCSSALASPGCSRRRNLGEPGCRPTGRRRSCNRYADRVGVAVKNSDDYLLLTGNEMGVLLLDYICKTRAARGENLTKKVAVTTIVSSGKPWPRSRATGSKARCKDGDVPSRAAHLSPQMLHPEPPRGHERDMRLKRGPHEDAPPTSPMRQHLRAPEGTSEFETTGYPAPSPRSMVGADAPTSHAARAWGHARSPSEPGS